MLNIAVVDDEPEAVEAIQILIKRYCGERDIEYAVSGFNDPVKFVAGYRPVYDIVFLDIEMPGLNGMDVARNLRKTDSEVALVFVTNMAQYAICGYEVDADDFVIKPLKYGNFEIKMTRILKKHGQKDSVRVTVYDDGAAKYILASDIRYVEVIKHSIVYHVNGGGRYEKRGVLKNEEGLFLENGFEKCNKSCLVNMRYVLGVDGYALHLAKARGAAEYEVLTISHPRKKLFVHSLNKYLEQHL